MNALDIHNLSVYFNRQIILNNISLSVPNGSRCAIIGPNGAGKTTLFQSIFELILPKTGLIKVLGNSFKKNYKDIAYVPQKKIIDWNFPITVEEVVLMAFKRIFITNFLKEEEYQIAYNALKSVDLYDIKDKQIRELSGGQQQRVFIARALAQKAKLYFMDEPFAGVDKTTEKMISSLFFDLEKEGNTIIVVHHDWNTLSSYFNWIICLNKKVIYQGPIDNNLEAYIDQTFS